jgi:hypothetical protein
MPVEALFPQGLERLELGSSGWARILGIDAVGGPPHCDFADEGDARVTSRWCPDWFGVTLAGVGLESLRQIVAPHRMGMERWWNAQEPRQRTWVDRRERWEAPVKDGGHVAGGAEVSSAGGCQHVAERVPTGFGRQREQVGPQGRPSRFAGESGDELVNLVELCDGLGSDKLLGRDMETVGVALDRLEQPAGLLSSRSKVLAETGASSLAMICCSVSVGVRGVTVSGPRSPIGTAARATPSRP